ncbi:MAG: DUF3306 domain-containing protein [Beijerinckiaceae bacterium]|nr:DUF3306 domain-containing protein [Beijerinckiaceae bacterium]
MSQDENFLARWSQRKRQVAREEQARPVVEETPASEPEIDLSLLPRLEDLTDATDISVFLQKGVPDSLRNAALRRAWALDPAVRDYVGDALDYAWDWNTPGGVPGSGEIQAGTDIAKLVSQVFGDAPQDPTVEKQAPDEKVITDVAAQNGMAGQPAEGLEPECNESIAADAPELIDDKSRSVEVIGTDLRSPEHVASQRKSRRHGGAQPST